MERYAENILVSIRVKQMYCWADSAWLYIFHFWKCVTQGIKALFENKAADPVPPKLGLPVSFFLSFFLSLSLSLSLSLFRLIPWSAEALWVYFPARGSKTLSRKHSAFSPHQEGLRPPWTKSRVRGFIGFLVNQRISASLSLLYFLSCRRHSSWGYPWILLGMDPGSEAYVWNQI